MVKERVFSLYDVEQFLRDAGAEKVHEKAIRSFEEELRNTLKEFINDAETCANYAGRRKLITKEDVELSSNVKIKSSRIGAKRNIARRKSIRTNLSKARALNLAVQRMNL